MENTDGIRIEAVARVESLGGFSPVKHRGLISAVRTGVGQYLLTTEHDVAFEDCLPFAQATGGPFKAAANYDSPPNIIQVLITNTTTGALADDIFNFMLLRILGGGD